MEPKTKSTLPVILLTEHDLLTSSIQSQLQTFLGLCAAALQSTLQLLDGRGLDEHVQPIQVRVLDLLHALHLNVQHTDLAVGLHLLHGRYTRAVHVAAELGRLQELIGQHSPLQLFSGHVEVVHAVLLSGPGLTGGVRYREAKGVRVLFHELLEQRALATA